MLILQASGSFMDPDNTSSLEHDWLRAHNNGSSQVEVIGPEENTVWRRTLAWCVQGQRVELAGHDGAPHWSVVRSCLEVFAC